MAGRPSVIGSLAVKCEREESNDGHQREWLWWARKEIGELLVVVVCVLGFRQNGAESTEYCEADSPVLFLDEHPGASWPLFSNQLDIFSGSDTA